MSNGNAERSPSASFFGSTGFLLSQLGVMATRTWSALLVERDLTPHHHAVLLTLQELGPLSLTGLARAVLVDPRNMGAVLDPLEQRGLLSRGSDPADRRRRTIDLTPQGAAMANELAAATAAIEDELLRPLPPAHREQFQGHLQALWKHNHDGRSMAPTAGA
jgi:DNA-binding MarR family transcriptional regulator